jgi:hypothetical protein
MKKGTMILVTIAAVGLIAWQGGTVSAQDDQSKKEPSAQTKGAVQEQGSERMRRGHPGYRLRKVDDTAKITGGQRPKINLLIEDERKQLNVLSADRSLSKEQKKEKYLQIRDATHDKIKALLPPEEQIKYEESQAKSKAFREALHKRTAQKSRQ